MKRADKEKIQHEKLEVFLKYNNNNNNKKLGNLTPSCLQEF